MYRSYVQVVQSLRVKRQPCQGVRNTSLPGERLKRKRRLLRASRAHRLACQLSARRLACRAADTGSASPPPPLAAARRGSMKHRRSRPTDLSRGAVSFGAHGADLGLRSQPAHRAVGLCAAAPSRTLQPAVVNGRTERRPIEAASSRRRWALGDGPSGCMDRRGSAQVAAERRSGPQAPRVSARRQFS